ncbi:DUF423 domain-containing protein [uncultured Muriicola sp.]|uniref:DUF423 domain-containing protein n=1 Tax=uncultured Muriicola sp. TaxID=1583102 RepID=UPI0026201281|nr:DUF423 domain-containing protein [uncultured Muriicola sp.]
MNRTILLTAVFFGVLSVILGAFGAHGLKSMLSESSLDSFQTGVTYQMYHALVLLWLGSTVQWTATQKKWIYYCFTIGVVFFSFSIYLLATNELTSINFKSLAFITPLGGGFLISGWVLIGHRVFKYLG